MWRHIYLNKICITFFSLSGHIHLNVARLGPGVVNIRVTCMYMDVTQYPNQRNTTHVPSPSVYAPDCWYVKMWSGVHSVHTHGSPGRSCPCIPPLSLFLIYRNYFRLFFIISFVQWLAGPLIRDVICCREIQTARSVYSVNCFILWDKTNWTCWPQVTLAGKEFW